MTLSKDPNVVASAEIAAMESCLHVGFGGMIADLWPEP